MTQFVTFEYNGLLRDINIDHIVEIEDDPTDRISFHINTIKDRYACSRTPFNNASLGFIRKSYVWAPPNRSHEYKDEMRGPYMSPV